MSDVDMKEFENRIISKAMKDDAYRQELLSDPRAVIERELGSALPADIEIKVLEQTPKAFYLVLPAQPETTRELSEDELDMVSGGLFTAPVIGATCRGSGCGETAITILVGGGCSIPRSGGGY